MAAMADPDDVDGVLITGVYGTGKSTVAAEIAETLERQGRPYGALDLDWLTWFEVPGLERDELTGVYLANVADVVRNYREAGVRYIVLAGAVRSRNEVDALQMATAVPLRVVRLEVGIDEIERRLSADPTTGRRDDLRVAMQWVADGVGLGIEDITIANDGSIQEVAMRILGWLGWIP